MAVKLAEKTLELFNYVQENGGKVSTDEAAEALGRNTRSISASLNSLSKNGLALREKVEGKEGAKGITYITLTDDGKNFVQPAGDEDEE